MLARFVRPIKHTRWKLLLGLLCIVLVILGGTLSSAHTHGLDEKMHADCALCLAAHATVHVVSPPVFAPPVRIYARVDAAQPVRRPHVKLAFDLFTRPPPANALLS